MIEHREQRLTRPPTYNSVKISRNELKSIFVSPVAWAMLVIFFVQTSISFLGAVATGTRWQFAGYEVELTRLIFEARGNVFETIYNNLMYYVPLLTMGLISREKHTGAIKLLMSSPVTISQIVLGKYLALVVLLLTFLVFVLGLVVISGLIIPNLDFGLALSGALGMYLLAATYAAVGLFMSSLTNHQVVAAISTIGLLAALNFVGGLGQTIPLLNDVAYWLSISGRAETMRAGLIASKDVLYFLSIIALFLSFTYLKLSAGRLAEPLWRRGLKYAGAALVVIVFGHVSSIPSLTSYADMTRVKSQTLAPNSAAALAGLEGTLRITVLVNALDPQAARFLPARRNQLYRQMFEKYERQIGRIEIDYKFYYAASENDLLYEANPGKTNEELARRFAEQNRLNFDRFLSEQDADREYGLSEENFRNIYLFEWQGKRSVLRNFDDPRYMPAEPAISAAISRLISPPVEVAYSVGNGERRIFRNGAEDHRKHISDVRDRDAILNRGFDVLEISLERPVPESVDILVLAAPTVAFSHETTSNLQTYIDSGGDLLFLGDQSSTVALNTILDQFGIRLGSEKVFQTKEEFPPDLIFTDLVESAERLGFTAPRRNQDGPIVLPDPATINILVSSGPTIVPILEARTDDAETAGSADQLFAVAFERDIKNTSQRIVIVSDADFLSTSTRSLRDPANRNNSYFINDMFYFLAHGLYPIDTSRPDALDTYIAIDLREVDYLRWLLLGLLPSLVIITGATVFIRRRRH